MITQALLYIAAGTGIHRVIEALVKVALQRWNS